MVVGHLHRTPYRIALSLGEWADANWGYIDGRLALTGSGLDHLSVARAANAVYAVLVEEARERGIPRSTLNDLLLSEWESDATAPDNDAEALEEFMGGITMEQLLGDEG